MRIARKIVQVCVFVPGTLIFVWLLFCKTFSNDLNHTDVDFYSLRRLYCDRCAYLLLPKSWKLKYILLSSIFLEEVKMFWNTLSSI